jgi:predicted lipoprotein with Yx(FWY)xxD motif
MLRKERGTKMKATRERVRRAPIVLLISAAAAAGTVSLLPAAAGAAGSGGLTVSSQTIGKMGKVLVANGRALYTLTPSATACGTGCLKIWPALKATTATAGTGVTKSKLGVTTASGGTHQITYNGKPLYFFSLDKKGTVKGNVTDQWGKWTAVVVAKPAGSHGGGSTSNSGGGSNAGGGGVNF